MKPLTGKQKLRVYRRVLAKLNLVLRKGDKSKWKSYVVFICNELGKTNPKRNVCSPECNSENNIVFNYPEIVKQKPEKIDLGDAWWEIDREGVLIRINVVETAIAEVLKNNPDLL